MAKIGSAALGLIAAIAVCALSGALPAGAQPAPSVARLDPGRSHIARIDITTRLSPAFGGKSFGQAGQYELLKGRAFGLADPRSAQNAGVVDIDKAPVNTDGLVEYSLDVMFLKPVDLTKANGTLIYEVTNRGRPLLLTSLTDGNGDFKDERGANPTFVLEQGYSLAWSGWQADIGGSEGGDLSASFPVATDRGAPITGMVRDEILLDGSSGAQIPAVPPNATVF